jgi:mono/diheme cytochrome c family protein
MHEPRRKRLALLGALLIGVVVAAGMAGGTRWYSQHQSEAVARALTAGEPSRAPDIIRRYGCSGCHTIPGIPGADGLVGASLSDIKRRVYVGGVAFNSPENLVRWIVSPQTFSEHSAMPATGISEAEARDVAAYLYAR